jgi:hypothetical protein
MDPLKPKREVWYFSYIYSPRWGGFSCLCIISLNSDYDWVMYIYVGNTCSVAQCHVVYPWPVYLYAGRENDGSHYTGRSATYEDFSVVLVFFAIMERKNYFQSPQKIYFCFHSFSEICFNFIHSALLLF